MPREQNIPLFLWIATAVLAHLTWGGGAHQLSEIVHERIEVRRFAETVSRTVRRANQPIEVSLGVDEGPEETEPEPLEPEPTEAPEQESSPAEPDPKSTSESRAEDRDSELEDQTEPPEPEPLEDRDEKEKEPEPKKAADTEAEPVTQTLTLPQRIAVQQSIKDPNQAPNPDAEFISDHDNRVAEQTQARITSAEQNDPEPSPGGTYQGPSDELGNAHVTEILQAEDRAGNPERAPGENTDGQEEYSASRPAHAGTERAQAELSQGHPQGSRRADVDPSAKRAGQDAEQAVAEQEEILENPDLMQHRSGKDQAPEARVAQLQRDGRQGKKKRLPPPRGTSDPTALFGLGSRGRTESGINLNLSHSAALATVGKDQLARQIRADGERRRSKHRGSWHGSGLERWRSAIENYVPHVKLGNQTALNTAAVPFGIYLNKIHNRLHPIFADQFLVHLNELPATHPLNRIGMKTDLELVLSRVDGSIVDMGVTRASGVTAFDIGALDSVQRASPFGAPPNAIISPDGNVYLHWEFHRDPNYACSTYFARPKMLRVEPKSAPLPSPSPSPFDPEMDPTRPPAGSHGFFQLPGDERPWFAGRLLRPE